MPGRCAKPASRKRLVLVHVGVALAVCFWISFGFAGLAPAQEITAAACPVLLPFLGAALLALARRKRAAASFAISGLASLATLICFPVLYSAILICLWLF
ncbi:hypothetical protein LE190_09615 [Massilia oculi]|uniref:Uncharacterized protein n=1 Tax=Massilia hydrophila TaxID=3044279 RepID=A0ABS7YAR0_9BURK|nr:hypothetical protein [Massilia oculi]MCA1856182.1 hypothetical protein [Massilia oculi]